MNKRIIATILGVFVLAFMVTATPVLAAEVNVKSDNQETGADSDNENIVIVEDEGDGNLVNVGTVDNTANAEVNTGKNDVEKNTTVEDVESGSVDASTSWETVANQADEFCGCPFTDNNTEVSADFLNKLTGAYSDNKNLLVVENEGDQEVTNVATILNSLGLEANTGYNDVEMNTTVADVGTGDISVDSGVSNWANTSSGGSNGSEDGSSIAVKASNDTTGAKSDNENKVIVENKGDQTLTNVATLVNTTNVKGNTGGNDVKKNTTVGDVSTGGIAVSTSIENVANTGTCCPSGGSTTEVSAELSNKTTGYDSDNENVVKVEDKSDKTVTNTATVSNSLNVEANTGHNDTEQNTTVENVTTGDVSVDFSSSTVVNSTN